MLVNNIPEGSLILARKGETVHTCVVVTDYTSIMVDATYSYYYVWSMTINSCILVYANEVMTVLDDKCRYEVKIEYSDLGVAEGYSINPFRWIPRISTTPEDFDHCDDDDCDLESLFELSGVDLDE